MPSIEEIRELLKQMNHRVCCKYYKTGKYANTIQCAIIKTKTKKS